MLTNNATLVRVDVKTLVGDPKTAATPVFAAFRGWLPPKVQQVIVQGSQLLPGATVARPGWPTPSILGGLFPPDGAAGQCQGNVAGRKSSMKRAPPPAQSFNVGGVIGR